MPEDDEHDATRSIVALHLGATDEVMLRLLGQYE
jgi:hypothetical protein